MNPGARRRLLVAALLAAAVLPALRHGGSPEPRAAAPSVPVVVNTSRGDLVTRIVPGKETLARAASPAAAGELPVDLVDVVIPRGYRAAGVEPAGVAELVGEGTVNGQRVASLAVHAATRDARGDGFRIRPRTEFEVTLRPEAPGAAPLVREREGRSSRKVAAELARSAGLSHPYRSIASMTTRDLGPDGTSEADFQVLGASAYPSLEGSLVEYLIITNDDMKDEFQPLADWYIQRGIPAAIRTIAQVEAAYPWGVDRAERLRLFIRDAFVKWGTAYVLLGGDVNVVPVRLVYNSYLAGDFIASDLYYEALDGTWDADGDRIFGERYEPGTGAPGDSIDLFPEVHVGRASVETGAEAATFVNKVLTYARDPEVGYQSSALLAGQVLFCEDPCHYPEDILLNGGTDILDSAAVYVPGGWSMTKLYEWPLQNESKASILAGLNQGYNLVALANHGDPFKMSTGDGDFLYIPDADALGNDRRFFNLFYLNCNTSEIEAECINEHMMGNPAGGAVSVISPTRFDFPHVGGEFIEEFYRLLFQGGVTEVGALQGLMKIPEAGVAYYDPAVLWNYTGYILLGDPAMPVWTVSPDTLVATGSGTIAVGDTAYTVSVTAQGSPVADALVTLWNPVTGEYGRAYTTAGGLAEVPFRATTNGSVRVTATHPAHLADLDSALVTGGSARLRVESLVIDDDTAGLSVGNGDGVIDAGEIIELGVRLRNGSSFPAPAAPCSLVLAPGSALGVTLTVDGLARRKLLFIGEGEAHPPAMPCTLSLGGGPAGMPSPLGKPVYLAGARADTTGDGTGIVNARAYLWEDAAGWHLRAAGAFANAVIEGTLGTNGSVRALAAWHTEPLDTVRDLGGGVVRFRFGLGASDAEDGLDLVLADSSHVDVLSGVASRPAIAPGGLGTVNYLVEVDGAARDGERRRLDLGMGAAGRDEVKLDLVGPRPVTYVVSTDDSTVSGDRDAFAEPGEIVRLWPRVRNEGGGKAVGITATARALTGGVMTDSLATVGDVVSGTLRGAGDPFQLTVTGAFPVITVKLADAYGTVWRDTLRLVPIAAPTGLVDGASPGVSPRTIDLSWNPGSEAALAGYLVYRAPAATGPWTLLTQRLLPRVSYYQDTAVLNDSLYHYTVTAVDSGGAESRRSATLAARCRPAPQGGWPQTMINASWAGPVLADIDLDGKVEIINGCFDGRVYVWNSNGTVRAGWPRSTGGEIWDTPSAANLDADPQLEIVVGSNDAKVYAWNHDGSGLLAPDGIFATTVAQVRCTPVLVDLDLDGVPEIVVGNSGGRLYAWKADGAGYLGGNPVFAFPSGTPIISTPAVGNADADPNPEVFVANLGGNVYAYNHDGTSFLGSGALFYGMADVDSAFWGALAMGDLDRDGAQDLVGASWNGKVYAWRMNGTLRPGFPKFIASGPPAVPIEPDGTSFKVWSSPALGDIDGDGMLDIVAGSRDRRVYAIRHDGAMLPGWPYVTGFDVYGGPALADIDDDHLPEVLVGSLDNAVHAVNGNGSRVPGWPVSTGEDVYATPAVADLDGDGKAEIAVGSYDGYMHVWATRKPWRVLSSPWPQFHHDIRHTGWYDAPLYTTDVAVPEAPPATDAPAVVMLSQNAPNPVASSTVIRFGLPRETGIRLAIFDVEGRHVRELARGPWSAGWHEVRWDGRDRSGREVAAGVYFYRLEAGGAPLSRKFIVRR